MKRFLFTGGGTMGSLAPLLAVAERLRARVPGTNCRFVVGMHEQETRVVTEAGFPCTQLSTGKMRRYFDLRNIADVAVTIAAFFRALRLLRAQRPDAVMTAGSFVSVPVVWAAKTLRIPVLVHQQDLRPGLANRLMLPCATVVTAAFPDVARRLGRGRTVRVTGNPVRQRLLRGDAARARSRYGFAEDRPLVLVLGGSTGAAALNELVRGAKEFIGERADVLHVVGGRGSAIAEGGYVAVAYLDEELADAFAAATLVVTRAGLSTLSELAVLKKPTIIMPIPDSHQEENAEHYYAHGAAVVLRQHGLTASSFAKAVLDLLHDNERRQRLSSAIGSLNPSGAAETLATELLRIAAQP